MKLTEDLIEEITFLTDKYYRLINGDHHKDRDCHWYINTVWSYGDKPKYRVEHFGYCYEDVNQSFKTYREAILFLISAIKDAIGSYEDSMEEE